MENTNRPEMYFCNLSSAEKCILDLQLSEVFKAVVHFSTALNVIFLYTLPSCGFYIRESLEMGLPDDPLPYFNPVCRKDDAHRQDHDGSRHGAQVDTGEHRDGRERAAPGTARKRKTI
ncbi:hypothetical protein pipiens_010360 [Culex pipiens pipiens]|uniref:Uncharacterized protein n=1 Tax=Culex pipiens pipiens TaxID=38569 RepID=A0ABD1DAN4_CULPP